MRDDLTTEVFFGYTRSEWLALSTAQRELIEKKATAARQAELQAELDAFTEAYFATDEWQLNIDGPLGDGSAHRGDHWFSDVDGILEAQ